MKMSIKLRRPISGRELERLMAALNPTVPTITETSIYAECERVLSVGEVIEKHCDRCGEINVREVLRA